MISYETSNEYLYANKHDILGLVSYFLDYRILSVS